jgi:peptidoglycan hydrolase-like protein with peptidoglycan-binding domain
VHARGQQKIDSERAQAIQEALIRAHYMTGEATGTWNQASEEAMRRYQADHGWQSKEVPDSRALIKLGLGPSKDHLLNPESAMTTVPDPPRAEPMPTTSHSAAPGTAPPPAKNPNQSDSSSRPQ